MKKIIIILLFSIGLPLFAQNLETYEAFEADLSTVYYTRTDSSKNIVLEEGTLVNGLRSGLWIQYYQNGKTQMIARFDGGIKIRSWKTYDSKGRIVSKVKYKKGKKIYASQYVYY